MRGLFLSFCLFSTAAGADPRCLHALLAGVSVDRDGDRVSQRLPLSKPYFPGFGSHWQLALHGVTGPGRFRTFRARRHESYAGDSRPLIGQARIHSAMFDRTVVAAAADKYRERRSEWGTEFVDTLEGIMPFFADDAVDIAVVDENDRLRGGLRVVALPYGWKDGVIVAEGPTVRARGYRDDRGFRPNALADFRLGIAPYSDADAGPPRPRRWLPGEELLAIEVPRPMPQRDPDAFGVRGGMAYELTSFYVDESLPPAERLAVWTQLWLAAATELTGPNLAANYTDSVVFTYGTSSSLRLYRPLGAERMTSYFRNGQRIGPSAQGVAPPVTAFQRQWWPLEFPLVRIEQFAMGISSGRGQFAHLNADEQLAQVTNHGKHPFDLFWSPRDVRRQHNFHSHFLVADAHARVRSNTNAPLTAARSEWALTESAPMLKGAVDELLRRVREGDATEREGALQQLASRRCVASGACLDDGPELRETLSLAATSDPEVAVRRAAWRALREYAVEGTGPVDRWALSLRESDLELRRKAATAITQNIAHGAKPSHATIGALHDASDNPDTAVAAIALQGLRFVDGADATRLLVHATQHPASKLPRDKDLWWTFGAPVETGWVHAAAAYRRAVRGAPGSTAPLHRILNAGPTALAPLTVADLLDSTYGDDALVEGLEVVVSWLERECPSSRGEYWQQVTAAWKAAARFPTFRARLEPFR